MLIPPELNELRAALSVTDVEQLSDAPESLDHYTRRDTLEKILSSGYFLAGDATALNDPRELQHGRDVVAYLLAQFQHDQSENSTLWRLVDFTRFAFLEHQPERHFVVSFSAAQAEVLSQWTAYAETRRGIRISIDTRRAFDYGGEVAPFRLHRVIYSESDQAALIARSFRIVRDFAATHLSHDSTVEDPLFAGTAALLAAHLTWHTVAFKPKWFIDEREWRLVQAIYPGDQPSIVKIGDREFVPFRLGSGPRLPIIRITMGPSADCEDMQRTKNTLAAYGYDAQVTRSLIQFRE